MPETVPDPEARPHRSLLNAALWAVKVGFACSLALTILIPGFHVEFLSWLVEGGVAIWQVLVGPDRDNAVWVLAVIVLNGVIYSVVVFVAERIFVLWKRWLHPVDNKPSILTR